MKAYRDRVNRCRESDGKQQLGPKKCSFVPTDSRMDSQTEDEGFSIL